MTILALDSGIKSLRTVCSKVDFSLSFVQLYVDKVVKEMFTEINQHDGLGIAANQVGYFSRIIVIKTRTTKYGPWNRVMVNPRFEVLDGSEDKILCKEGCLSFPGLFIQRARPDKIRVHWTSQDGKDIKSEEFSGITSVCIQHEIEHLDAKLFFDGVSDFKLKRSIEEANKKGYSYNYSDFRWDGMYY